MQSHVWCNNVVSTCNCIALRLLHILKKKKHTCGASLAEMERDIDREVMPLKRDFSDAVWKTIPEFGGSVFERSGPRPFLLMLASKPEISAGS